MESLGGLWGFSWGFRKSLSGRSAPTVNSGRASGPLLETVFKPSWALLGVSCAVLRLSWGLLGLSWRPLGQSWGDNEGLWGGPGSRKGENAKYRQTPMGHNSCCLFGGQLLWRIGAFLGRLGAIVSALEHSFSYSKLSWISYAPYFALLHRTRPFSAPYCALCGALLHLTAPSLEPRRRLPVRCSAVQ